MPARIEFPPLAGDDDHNGPSDLPAKVVGIGEILENPFWLSLFSHLYPFRLAPLANMHSIPHR
jgi:hypothetical protein